MENNPEPIKEILDELFSLLESLETQTLAVTQFLKDQGIATDKKLAPYLDQAGNASSVKWRAARARMHYLLSPVAKKTDDTEKDKNKDKNKEPEKPPAEKQSTSEAHKPSAEKVATEKPPREQNKQEGSDGAKDSAQNKGTKPDKAPQPAAPNPTAKEGQKQPDTPEKSKRA
jgi:N-acetylmuramoyl-L-alanine amidase CwlA